MTSVLCRIRMHKRPDVDYNVGVVCARGCGYRFPAPTSGLAVMPLPRLDGPPPPPPNIPPSPAVRLMREQARLARAEAERIELDNKERRRRLETE